MERKSGSKSRITTQNAARDDEFDAKHYRVRTEKRIEGQEARIKALEAHTKRQAARIARLEARSPDRDFEFLSSTFGQTTETKRGPRPRYSNEIYKDRDMFVRFLEQYWPEIEPLCVPKLNLAKLKVILSSFPVQKFGQVGETANRLLDRLSFIEDSFTHPQLSARFRNDPRVLAGALAGVPEVGLWRSLKLCPPRGCNVPMGDRAMRSYLHRKHPALHRALRAGMNITQTMVWLKEYQTRDKLLKS